MEGRTTRNIHAVETASINALYIPVLIAAVAHASWNAVIKSSADRLLMLTFMRVVGFILGLVVACLVPPPSARSMLLLVSAAAIHYVYYYLMLRTYHAGDMSQVYPISRGTAPLLVALLAALFAGEVLRPLAAAAVVILSSGILALALSGHLINRKAVHFALLTGIAIASYSFLSGMGVRESGSVLGYAAWLEIATSIGMVSVMFMRTRTQILSFAWQRWRIGLIAGLLSAGGYATALWAMSVLPLAPVIALRETSVVFAAIIGSVVLGEGFAARRIAAATAVLVGVVLLGVA
jgi:drug/metabolite transporter (DMT)-like permease